MQPAARTIPATSATSKTSSKSRRGDRNSSTIAVRRLRNDDGVARLQREILLQVALFYDRREVEGDPALTPRVLAHDDDPRRVGEPSEAARERQSVEHAHLVIRCELAAPIHLADDVDFVRLHLGQLNRDWWLVLVIL